MTCKNTKALQCGQKRKKIRTSRKQNNVKTEKMQKLCWTIIFNTTLSTSNNYKDQSLNTSRLLSKLTLCHPWLLCLLRLGVFCHPVLLCLLTLSVLCLSHGHVILGFRLSLHVVSSVHVMVVPSSASVFSYLVSSVQAKVVLTLAFVSPHTFCLPFSHGGVNLDFCVSSQFVSFVQILVVSSSASVYLHT